MKDEIKIFPSIKCDFGDILAFIVLVMFCSVLLAITFIKEGTKARKELIVSRQNFVQEKVELINHIKGLNKKNTKLNNSLTKKKRSFSERLEKHKNIVLDISRSTNFLIEDSECEIKEKDKIIEFQKMRIETLQDIIISMPENQIRQNWRVR